MDTFVSRRPYLIPAYYQWLLASGLKPHLVVSIDYPGVSIPSGYDEDGKIVLNIHSEAARNVEIDGHWIIFDAIFEVHPVKVRIPMGAVLLMFALDTAWFDDFSNDPDPGVGLASAQISKKSSKHLFQFVPQATVSDAEHQD